MEYKSRAKNRKIKRYVVQSAQLLKFKGIHLSLGGKISTIGSLTLAVSCFLNWVISTDNSLSGNAYTAVAGRVGITLSLVWLGVLFLIFSINKKEKLKLGTDLNFRDYNAIIMGGIMTILLSIHSYIFIGGFQSFSSTVGIGKGPIFSLIGGVFITLGGYFIKKEMRTTGKGLVFTELEGKNQEENLDENMRLPF